MVSTFRLFLEEPEIKSALFISFNLLASVIVRFTHGEWPLSLLWSFLYVIFILIVNHGLASGRSYLPISNMSNKIVVITGATSGIGYATAVRFAKLGAQVIIGVRGEERAEQFAAEIRNQSNNKMVTGYNLDLTNLNSVKEFALKMSRVDILINNAGCLKQKYEVTSYGVEEQFAANYLGHFYLTLLLLPLLTKSRVLNVSSIAHHACKRSWVDFSFVHFKKSYDELEAYSLTKLLQIYHARELKRRHNINAYSLHPGTIMSTNFNTHRPFWQYLMLQILLIVSKTIEQGTMTLLYCALSNDAKPGFYHSDCQVREPSELGSDSRLAEQCWDDTERLITEKLK